MKQQYTLISTLKKYNPTLLLAKYSLYNIVMTSAAYRMQYLKRQLPFNVYMQQHPLLKRKQL